MKYIKGEGPHPDEDLTRFLIPGRNQENPERSCFEDITTFFANYPHGAAPRIDVLCDASKSSLSLFNTISRLHCTDHLRNAEVHFRSLMKLIAYRGEPQMLCDEFTRRMIETREGYLKEREADAMELGIWLSSPDRPPSDPREAGSLSKKQDDVRRRAVSLMKGYQAKTGGSWRSAEAAVQKVMWKEFNAVGLKSANNNFHSLRYAPRFSSSPAAGEEALCDAGLMMDL